MRRVEMKKQYILGALIFVIALVTVGFALLQSNLNINGTVATKSNSWSVYFSNIQMNSESVSKTLPTISNKTSLNFNVELATPGNLYGFTVDAVNDGTIDAKIGTVSISNLTTEQAKLIDLSITYENGTQIQENDELKANSTKRIKVLVKYKDNINPEDLPNSNVSVNITFTTDYVQSDESAREEETIVQGDLYNLIESKADKTTVINFNEHSGISGTNGIYTTTATEGNVPVYYYRGAADQINNNLIFNNMCWKIIRTTETGGVKLIFNGTATEDGKCKVYYVSSTESNPSSLEKPSSSYYYAESYTFDSNTGLYSLGYGQPGTLPWGEVDSMSYIEKYPYTCMTTSTATTCSTLYKLTGYVDSTHAYYVSMKSTLNTETQIGTSKFNNEIDNADVGYMYGTRNATNYAETHANINNSTIKSYLDNWFMNNFDSAAISKLEDTIFCNDRSTVAGGNNNVFDSTMFGTIGYGNTETGYGALSRSSQATLKLNPTYKCPQANDKFTLKTTQVNYNSSLNGNKKLDYPVGLITLDEAIFAGLNGFSSNAFNYIDKNNYLNNASNNYWTISPMYRTTGYAFIGTVSSGSVGGTYDYYTSGVRPVISLKTGILIENGGTGTPENPYVVK